MKDLARHLPVPQLNSYIHLEYYQSTDTDCEIQWILIINQIMVIIKKNAEIYINNKWEKFTSTNTRTMP